MVFDDLTGSGTIENGVGKIDEFQLKSSQMMASMTGTANLLRERRTSRSPWCRASTPRPPRWRPRSSIRCSASARWRQLLFADEFSKVFTLHYRVPDRGPIRKITKVEDNKPRQPSIQDRATEFLR